MPQKSNGISLEAFQRWCAWGLSLTLYGLIAASWIELSTMAQSALSQIMTVLLYHFTDAVTEDTFQSMFRMQSSLRVSFAALLLDPVIQSYKKYQIFNKNLLGLHPIWPATVFQWWKEFFCWVPSAVKGWGGRWCREKGWGGSWRGQIWRGSRVYIATLDVIYNLFE